jgi:RHS repeat-associated protein
LQYFNCSSGALLSLNLNGTEYFYVSNLQGDIIEIVDINGNRLVTYQYDAWGNLENYSDYSGVNLASKNPYRYRSYRYDNETGYYYLQSRYYDPSIGRFISADNVGYLGAGENLTSYNLYAYCGNNPVMKLDPSGCFWDYIFDAIFIVWGIIDMFNGGYKDWKNWVALGVDVVFAVIPFVPSGVGQAIKVGNKIDDALDVASAINKIDNIQDLKKVTIIGRNMNRVTDTAHLIGKADNLYDAWKGYDRVASFSKPLANGLSAAHNGGWLLGKLRRGYTVIDIGITTVNKGRGLWYGTERLVQAVWETRNIWKYPVNCFF